MQIHFARDIDDFPLQLSVNALIIMEISRESIERQDIDSLLSRLRKLSESPTYVSHQAGSVALVFEGYDDDPRAMPTVVEAQTFFKAIDKEWSYWAHFLCHADDSIQIALGLVADARMVGVEDGITAMSIDISAAMGACQNWVAAAQELHREHGLPAIASGDLLAKFRNKVPFDF